MSMQKYWLGFLVYTYIVSFNTALFAQTTRPIKDLSIGNRWIFSFIRTEKGLDLRYGKVDKQETFSYYEQVLKDTNIAGKKYSQIYNSEGSSVRWERSDEKAIYLWNGSGEVVAFSTDATQDIFDNTYTIYSDYVRSNLTISTQYRRGLGFYSQIQRYKIESWQMFGQPHFNIPTRLVYEAIVEYTRILKGANTQNNVWGDTSFAFIKLSIPDTTTLRADTSVVIPIRYESTRELKDVFNSSPTVTLFYEPSALEVASPQTTATTSSVYRSVLLPIPLSGELPGIEFRIQSTSIASSSRLFLDGKIVGDSKIPYQIVSSSGIIKFVGSTFSVIILADSVKCFLNEKPVLPITIIGTRELVKHGINSLSIALNLPRSIAMPTDRSYYYSSIDNNIVNIPIVLPTNSDTCFAQIPLRINILTDTIVKVSVVAVNPIPNAAQIFFSSRSTTLNLKKQIITLQPTISNVQGETDSLVTVLLQIPNILSSKSQGIGSISGILKIPNDVAVPDDVFFPKYQQENGFYLVPILFESGAQIFWRRIRLRIKTPQDTSILLQLGEVKPQADFGANWHILPATGGNLRVQNPIVSIVLKVSDIEARVGNVISIPIVLNSSVLMNKFGIDSVKLSLDFNASTLEPMQAIQGQIENGIRSIPLVIPLLPSSTRNQIEVSFRTTIGSTTVTRIVPQIQPFFIRGITTKLLMEPGRIVTNNNFAGGTPLLFFSSSANKLALNWIAPNPSKDLTNISYTLSENMPLEIAVYDMVGNKMQTLLTTSEQKSGAHTITLRTSDLASGQYRIMLIAPSGTVQEQLNVVR